MAELTSLEDCVRAKINMLSVFGIDLEQYYVNDCNPAGEEHRLKQDIEQKWLTLISQLHPQHLDNFLSGMQMVGQYLLKEVSSAYQLLTESPSAVNGTPSLNSLTEYARYVKSNPTKDPYFAIHLNSFLEVEDGLKKIKQEQEKERQLHQQKHDRILRILRDETARYHTEKQDMDAKVRKALARADYKDALTLKQIDDLTLQLLEQSTMYEGKLKRLAEKYKQLEVRIAEQQKEAGRRTKVDTIHQLLEKSGDYLPKKQQKPDEGYILNLLLNSTEEPIISAVASVAKRLRDEKKTVECIRIYEQLTKNDPNNHHHHYFLATAYEQVNRLGEAKEQYLLAGKGSSASAGLARINQKLGVTD